VGIPSRFKHQNQSVKFKRDHPRSLDTSDCGTGKTRTEIDTFAEYGAKCALVLAPKSILEPAWAEDIRTFAPHLKYSIAYAKNREEAFAANADMYITNHDAVKWLAKQSPKFFDRFSDLIVDESTAFKHRTSARSGALNKIKRYFPVRRLDTATPNPNTILDIWHQINVLDDGKRLGQSFFAFRNAVCVPTQRGPEANMLEWADKEGAETAVYGLIADITIRHQNYDLPPNHQYTRPIALSAKHRALYKQLERDSLLQIDQKTITAVNGAVLAAKLLQIASGAVYGKNDDTGEGEYVLMDTRRYELTLDLCEEARQSVVFFQWRHQKEQLAREAEKRGHKYAVLDGSITNIHKRNEIVRNFQAGFYRDLFVHPQTGAHGLTLTRGQRTIFPSPTYNQELFHQAIKRIHRAGQTEVTDTITLIAPDTYDEIAYASCMGKGGRMYGLLDLMAA
jgi:SNF2 family DNA or RNA helicase